MATGGSTNGNGEADNKIPIVSALLTFTVATYRNSTHDRIVQLLTSQFDIDEIKNAKKILCETVQKEYKNRKNTGMRSDKTAHAIEICDIIRSIDDANMPMFVMDSISFANLPRVTAEDISYVAVADKLADITAKLNLMNDSISANTARCMSNSDRIHQIVEDFPKLPRQPNVTMYGKATGQSNCRIDGITKTSYAANFKIPPPPPRTDNGVRHWINAERHRVSNPGLQEQQGETPPAMVQQEQQLGISNTQSSTTIAAAGNPVADVQSRDNNNIPLVKDIETAGQQNHDSSAKEQDEPDSENSSDTQQGGVINPELQDNNNHVVSTDTDGHMQPPGDNKITLNNTDAVIIENNHDKSSDIRYHESVQNPATSNPGNGLPSSDTWQIPKMHAKKLDRFLLKNQVHGTARSTKVKGATAPPNILFISRLDGETTEADIAEYILDLGVHIVDLEQVSHYDARNKSFKLTVNKKDYYSLLNDSLWPDGVRVGKFRNPKPRPGNMAQR